ncbi:MAG: VWA domain-containing protein, partial [Verrucomicrobia bacterium]|nr:VWA domain-containing protein [Verrucomicrobiota bacterium]
MHFDFPFPFWFIGLCVLLAALGVVWSVRRLQAWIPGRYRITLGLLRGAALLALFLALANPYFIREEPDPEAFELVLLADASGSMETPDTQRATNRAAAVRSMIEFEEPDNLFSGPLAKYPVNPYIFRENTLPWRFGGVYETGGQSAPGDSLLQVLSQSQNRGRSLGGVLLISDGHENSGTLLIEAARQFRDADIPISVIGVGENAPPGDISVRFTDSKLEAEVGDVVTVAGTVTNAFNTEKTVTVQLFRGGEWLEDKIVTLDPGETRNVMFEDRAEYAGVRTYRLRVEPLVEDTNPASDVDFATMEIKKPDEYRLLYLGSQLHWEFRFLKQALKDDARFQLDSFIRTGPKSYLQNRAAEEKSVPLKELPREPSFYFEYDAFILDTRLTSLLNEEILQTLRKAVTRRGAGLLALGPMDQSPQSLTSMLPVKEAQTIFYKDKRFLKFEANPVFTGSKGGSLFQSPGPYLPENTPVYLGTSISRGGRISAATRGRDNPILVVQAFGAGSTAYLGTENTWRWRMESDKGKEQHSLFWRQLLFWLASGGKERLDMPLQGTVQSLDSQVDLDLKVRAQDFGPESQARVSATIEKPGGGGADILLNPSLTLPGQYEGDFLPNEAGEFHVRYSVVYGDGELLEHD